MDSRLIKAQLERICSSKGSLSPAMKAFLRYVTEETLAGRSGSIKAYSIAVDAMGKGENFDPQLDSSIRVLARRLRMELRRYYEGPGRNDPICITLPKGRYLPEFSQLNDTTTPFARENLGKKPTQKNSDRWYSSLAVKSRFGALKLAVFPYQYNRENQFADAFAHDLGEDLSARLSKFHMLQVVSYPVMLEYVESGYSIANASNLLGVDYLISGKVRQQGDTLRITNNVTHCRSGRLIWSQTFYENVINGELYGVLKKISTRIVDNIGGIHGIIVRNHETIVNAKPDKNIGQYYMVQYHNTFLIAPDADNFNEVAKGLQKALSVEPDNFILHCCLAELYIRGWLSYCFPENIDRDMIQEHITKLMHLNYHDPVGQVVEANFLFMQREFALARKAYYKVLPVIGDDSAFLTRSCGFFIALMGEFDTGIGIMDACSRRAPHLPESHTLPHYLHYMRRGAYIQGFPNTNRFVFPGYFWTPLLKAVAMLNLGRPGQAEAAFSDLLSQRPDFISNPALYIDRWVIPEDLHELFSDGLKTLSANYESIGAKGAGFEERWNIR